ncbi:MAG: hypothetical protein ACRDWH_03445 [Acidimicrobiia bacterium]
MRRSLVALFAAALVITSCGGDSELEESLRLNDDPGSVLLLIRDEGGFVPVDFAVGQGPRLVLLRDGTLIVPGPQIEIFPGPLLPNYQQLALDEETQLFVLEELDAIGFADIENDINNEATNSVADASTTITTFYNQDGAHTFSVYALGIGLSISDGRVPILANLVDRLSQFGFSQPGESYEWEAMEVLASVPLAPPEPQFANVKPWPLPVAFEQMADIGFGWRCASYEDGEVQALLAQFADANQTTTWDDAGTEYTIRAKPLFPGQEPCARLDAAG